MTVDFNLLSAITSLVLSIVAIWLSLYFYNQSKNTENNVNSLLNSIRTQVSSLETLTLKQLDRFTKYATTSKPADETNILLLRMVENMSTSTFTTQPIAGGLNLNDDEIISSYITLHFYSAITNVALQVNLPNLDQLQDGDNIKRLIDGSHEDFTIMDSYLSTLDSTVLQRNRLFNLYNETINIWKQYVNTSLGVYRTRQQALIEESNMSQ